VEAGPPLTCIYCGEPIAVGVEAIVVTQVSIDERGEPDFATQTVEGVAHPECWERERPEPPKQTA
jgi:hypothetical protein